MQFLADAFNQYGWAGVVVILIGFTWITKVQNDSKVSNMNVKFQDTVNTIAIDERKERLAQSEQVQKQGAKIDDLQEIIRLQTIEISKMSAQIIQLRSDLIECMERNQAIPQ